MVTTINWHVVFSVFYILSIALLCSCESPKIQTEVDQFIIYKTTVGLNSNTGAIQFQLSVDHMVSFPKNQPLEFKVKALLDSISKYNFDSLILEYFSLTENPDSTKSLVVNLKESPTFIIPDSVGTFNSWYEIFLGSFGAEKTSVVLSNSILQKEFTGDWIDEVEFYYQNNKISDWDLPALSGVFKRK